MSAEESKALMHRFSEGWNRGDMEALNRVIDETVDADFVNHSAANPEEGRGPEGVKGVFGAFREAFPDGRTTIEAMVAEGATVVT
jgi:predicted ester cyclase